VPPVPSTLAEWKISAKEYPRIIEKFETMQRDMRERRRSATDSVMVIIDERLKLNDRILHSMRMGLKMAEEEIKRLEA
jgi:hypothetical protein